MCIRDSLQSDINSNRVYVLCLAAQAKMSLSRAQNIFMPANINSIVIFFLTSLAHSCMIPITGKTTSSFPSTNRVLSMGTAPAARMTWIFLGHLLQLHKALQAFRNSWKSFTSLGTFLLRLLLSGWMMFTWRASNNEGNFFELMVQMCLNYSAFKGVQLLSQN